MATTWCHWTLFKNSPGFIGREMNRPCYCGHYLWWCWLEWCPPLDRRNLPRRCWFHSGWAPTPSPAANPEPQTTELSLWSYTVDSTKSKKVNSTMFYETSLGKKKKIAALFCINWKQNKNEFVWRGDDDDGTIRFSEENTFDTSLVAEQLELVSKRYHRGEYFGETEMLNKQHSIKRDINWPAPDCHPLAVSQCLHCC